MISLDKLAYEIGCLKLKTTIQPVTFTRDLAGDQLKYVLFECDYNLLLSIYDNNVLRVFSPSVELFNILYKYFSLVRWKSDTQLYDIILSDQEKLEFQMEYFS